MPNPWLMIVAIEMVMSIGLHQSESSLELGMMSFLETDMDYMEDT